MSKETSKIYHLSEECLEISAAKDHNSILESGAEDSPTMDGKDAPVHKMTHKDHTCGNIATQVESTFEEQEETYTS